MKRIPFILTVVVLIFAGFFLLYYFTVGSYKERILQLEKENQALRFTIVETEKNLQRIEETLIRIDEYRKRIAAALGLSDSKNGVEIKSSGRTSQKAEKQPNQPRSPNTVVGLNRSVHILKKTEIVEQSWVIMDEFIKQPTTGRDGAQFR